MNACTYSYNSISITSQHKLYVHTYIAAIASYVVANKIMYLYTYRVYMILYIICYKGKFNNYISQLKHFCGLVSLSLASYVLTIHLKNSR